MKKLSLAILIIVTSTALVGCGSDTPSQPLIGGTPGQQNQNQNQFSYHYILCANCSNRDGCYTDQSQCYYGGCTTGIRSATTIQDACNQLSSGSLNNYCESDVRREMFEKLGCTGQFTS